MTQMQGPPEDQFAPSLAGRRCLVLGAGGFLGRGLVAALSRCGAEVSAFGPPPASPDELSAGVEWTAGRLEQADLLREALSGQEFIFHLAGSALPAESNANPAAHFADAVTPTLKLLEACAREGVRKVLFASSGGTVYGIPAQVPIPETAPTNPITAYGIAKLTIEKCLELNRHLHGLDYHALRIANVYGAGQSPFRGQGVIAAMMNKALNGEQIEIWGDGSVIRDFIHVDDVAEAFAHCAIYDGKHRIMNVGSGEGRDLLSVRRDVMAAVGAPDLHPVYREGRAADVPANILDTRLIRTETRWAPRVTWRDGIEATARWLAGRTLARS